jgi:transposase
VSIFVVTKRQRNDKKFTELTDSQWAAISPFFNLKCNRRHDLRRIMNALLYLLRTSCEWWNLPENFPPWPAVNYYFESNTFCDQIKFPNTFLQELSWFVAATHRKEQ